MTEMHVGRVEFSPLPSLRAGLRPEIVADVSKTLEAFARVERINAAARKVADACLAVACFRESIPQFATADQSRELCRLVRERGDALLAYKAAKSS